MSEVEEEIEIEEEEEVEILNRVVFTHSDYHVEGWDGFEFPVVEIEGKKYLDPDLITRTTPASKGANKLTLSTKQALEKYGDETPPVRVYADPKRVIQDLVALNPEIKINYSDSEEKLFAQVVLEMSNIWNGKYRTMKGNPTPRDMQKRVGSSWNTVKQYLHVAEVAGLFNPFTRGKPTRKPRTLTKDEKEAQEDMDEFLDTKVVQQWIKKNETASQPKNQDALYQAMRLMNVSPDRLYEMAQGDNVQSMEDIGELMERGRFKDLRSAENILPKSAMVTRKGKDWQLPSELMTGDKHTRGAWYWNQFGLEGKPKVWYYKTKDANPDEYKNKLWSLREWAISPDAPEIKGKVQEVSYKNQAGKWKKAKVFYGKARQLSEKSIEAGDENVLYNFVGVLRQFLETHGMSFGKVDEDSIWAQVVNPPRDATIHLTIDQLENMKNCLNKGKEDGTTEVIDYHNYETPKEKVLKFKDEEEAKSYWHDAYFYFLLALELGFRQEEAFTIVGEKTKEVDEKDKTGKSGVIEFPNGDMKVQIYTRKGERGKKGQKIHGGFILSDETKQLIKDRMEQIKIGKESKDPKKYGTVKIHDNKPYRENSLIGASGKYTELGTLDYPATLMKKDKDKRTVKAVGGNRKKVMAILRHCYRESGLEDDYFYLHTLHSLRHMFAQYWLELSEYNYSFVAKLGHWKTESIVKSVYGKDLGSRIMDQMRDFATKDPFKKLHENKLKREQEPSRAEQLAIKNLGYGDEEELEREDERLRQKIFFEGGDYYDVRLPEDERVIIHYEVGTDLGVKDKSKSNPMKKFILYKKETAQDKTSTDDIAEGK